MNVVFFKKITADDLEEVADIYNYFVVHTTISFDLNPLTIDEIRANVIHPDPRFQSFLILHGGTEQSGNEARGGKVAGYVLITQYKKKPGYDESGEVTIYLKPEYVGRGIGGKALQYIEDVAKKNGFHVLIATICAENDASKFLFEKNGYKTSAHLKEIGYKFGRRLDILIYQKII